MQLRITPPSFLFRLFNYLSVVTKDGSLWIRWKFCIANDELCILANRQKASERRYRISWRVDKECLLRKWLIYSFLCPFSHLAGRCAFSKRCFFCVRGNMKLFIAFSNATQIDSTLNSIKFHIDWIQKNWINVLIFHSEMATIDSSMEKEIAIKVRCIDNGIDRQSMTSTTVMRI